MSKLYRVIDKENSFQYQLKRIETQLPIQDSVSILIHLNVSCLAIAKSLGYMRLQICQLCKVTTYF